MKLFLLVVGGFSFLACAGRIEQPVRAAAGHTGKAPRADHTASIETSHVYLLSPGKDAVRVVVSR